MGEMKTVSVQNLGKNPFELFKNAVVGVLEADGKSNAITLGWGGLGRLYEKDVIFLFVRDSRYSYELFRKSTSFSVCFFAPSAAKIVSYFGTVSGRNEDKIAHSGLTLAQEDGIPYFREAEGVIFARKLLEVPLPKEAIWDPQVVQAYYPRGGFHTLFAGEIQKIFLKK